MSLITVILVLVVVGVLMALLNKYGSAWISQPWLQLINIVAIVATVIWLLKVFGLWSYLATITV